MATSHTDTTPFLFLPLPTLPSPHCPLLRLFSLRPRGNPAAPINAHLSKSYPTAQEGTEQSKQTCGRQQEICLYHRRYGSHITRAKACTMKQYRSVVCENIADPQPRLRQHEQER